MAEASTTTIRGVTYRIEKLDPRKQFHVTRRLIPVFSSLGEIPTGEGEALNMLGPMAKAVADMPDADADFVINTCLAVIYRSNDRHGGNGWSPVAASNGRVMFDDIDMPTMLQLVGAVLQENLGGFFGGAASTSGPGETSQPA